MLSDKDEQLVEKANAGDLLAFDTLVCRYAERVFRLALRMLGNREDAEDIQQETFILAYKHLRSYRGDAPLVTWIFAIAAKQCISKRRRIARIPFRIITSDELDEQQQMPVFSCEEAERVQRALTALHPTDRLLIILKLIEGLSHEEIARILNCSVESSRSRLNRAKKLFRESYN